MKQAHGTEDPGPVFVFVISEPVFILPTLLPEGVKKLAPWSTMSFRRKPESRIHKGIWIFWTPVFTGVTNKQQFFHSFPSREGKVIPGQ